MTPALYQDSPIILWIGRFFAHDGYGTAARLHLAALRDAGAPVVGIDFTTRSVVGSIPDGLILTARSRGDLTIRAVEPDRPITAIVHDRPDRYKHIGAAGRSRLIGYTYWETTSLPPDWAALMQSMDQIWTSSPFNADAFARAGVPDWLIDVVSHPVDQLARDAAASRKHLRTRWPESTVFLSIVSSAVGRRDLNLLFEAFAMAFDDKDDVALVLKVPENGLDGVSDTVERAMLSMPARASGRWPNLYVVPANLTREQLIRLHGSVDCYVSCERGNGWDLPAFDSMAMGIPVVAANFGASTSFLDADDSYVVNVGSKFVACDAAFNERHSLYSGQYWPYVDPAALASELRRVHEAPADRRKRGAAAAERINHDYEPGNVAAEVFALAATTRDIDLRSARPAEVRVAAKETWTRFDGAPTFATHGRLHEAALAGLLVDPDFLQLRHPRNVWRAYKRATAYARAHDKALTGTPLRQTLSKAMATPTIHPFRKLAAIADLRRRVVSETARLGDREDLRELTAVVEGYQAAVQGGSMGVSSDHLERVWRTIDANYGLMRTPDAELTRLRELRNAYQGRVFILGNGPSLLKCDLSKLADEFTFAVNKIHLLFASIEWRPTFYTLLDRKMGAAVRDDVGQLDACLKFFPERFRGLLPAGPTTYWYWTRPMGTHIDDQFERDITRGIPSRATVLVTAIQQAFYLGFREIILIGVDAEYTIPETVEESGPDQFGTGRRLHLKSTADDDPNHFSPRYFGEGAEWHDPNVDDMHRMFRIMRKGVEVNGGRLLNASVGGSLDVLERVDYDELFR